MEKKIIKEFLNSWKEGVIEIGSAYQKGGNFTDVAEIFIEKHYAFSETNVLFKPLNEDEVTKVAFTFVFTKINNSLKIKVHHSSPVF